MTPRRAAAAIAAMALSGALTACTPEQPTPNPSSTTTSTTSSPTTSTTAVTTTAPLTPEQQAYADAEKVYRAWVANYGDAATTFDVSKINRQLITDQIFQAHKDFFERIKKNEPGTVGRWTQDIRSITGTRFVPGQQVQLQVCAVTNDRFLQNGVDITRKSDGTPAPVITTPDANQIQLISDDGGRTWKVSYWVLLGGQGASC